MNGNRKQGLVCLGLILASIGWLWLLFADARGTETVNEMKMIRISPQILNKSDIHE